MKKAVFLALVSALSLGSVYMSAKHSYLKGCLALAKELSELQPAETQKFLDPILKGECMARTKEFKPMGAF